MWSNTLSPSIFSSITFHNISDNWREDALTLSRRKFCQYALITNLDFFLIENSLKKLIQLNHIVVSPLLNSPFSNNYYSNVYGLLNDDFVTRKVMLSQRVCNLFFIGFTSFIFLFFYRFIIQLVRYL